MRTRSWFLCCVGRWEVAACQAVLWSFLSINWRVHNLVCSEAGTLERKYNEKKAGGVAGVVSRTISNLPCSVLHGSFHFWHDQRMSRRELQAWPQFWVPAQGADCKRLDLEYELQLDFIFMMLWNSNPSLLLAPNTEGYLGFGYCCLLCASQTERKQERSGSSTCRHVLGSICLKRKLHNTLLKGK